jgi:hypothetical protein
MIEVNVRNLLPLSIGPFLLLGNQEFMGGKIVDVGE